MLARPFLRRYAFLPSRSPSNTPTITIARAIIQRSFYTSSTTALSEPRAEEDEGSKSDQNQVRWRYLKFQRSNRTGHKFSEKRANLGVNTLGKPAEVLILRNTEPSSDHEFEEDVSTASEIEEFNSEGGSFDSLAVSVNQDILASLNEESSSKGVTKAEQQAAIISQLENLRPQRTPGVLQPVLSRKEFAKLQKQLEGFTNLQLNNYYNSAVVTNPSTTSTSSLKKGGPRIDWWPWQPGKVGTWTILRGHRSRRIVKFKNRDHAIATILRSLWEVVLQDEPGFSGHIWRVLNDSSMSVLSAGNPSHLEDVSRSWKVKIQQYNKGTTKGFYIIGSKSNCISATRLLDEKFSQINTDVMPLEPFSSQKGESLALLRSIPQENLDNIAKVTRTSIRKASDGIAGPNISLRSVDGQGLKAAKAAVLDLVLAQRDSSPTIMEDSAVVILHQVQTSAGKSGPPLARLSHLLRKHHPQSSKSPAISDDHSRDDKMMQNITSLPVSGEVYSNIKLFCNEGPPTTHIDNDLLLSKTFGISQLTCNISATLGQVLYDDSGPGFTKPISTTPKSMSLANKFLSTTPNPLKLLSQLDNATLKNSGSVSSMTFVPDPFEQLDSIQSALDLPKLCFEFSVAKSESNQITSVNPHRAYLKINESRLFTIIPSHPIDIRFQKTLLAELDHDLINSNSEFVAAMDYLKAFAQGDSTLPHLQRPNDIHFDIPRSLLKQTADQDSADELTNSILSSAEDTVKVKYTFMSHEIRQSVNLKVQEVPAKFSTIKAGIIKPEGTELLLHYDRPISQVESITDAESDELDKFLSSTIYLLDMSRVTSADVGTDQTVQQIHKADDSITLADEKMPKSGISDNSTHGPGNDGVNKTSPKSSKPTQKRAKSKKAKRTSSKDVQTKQDVSGVQPVEQNENIQPLSEETQKN